MELADQHWVTNTVALTTERQRKNTMNIVNWTQMQNPFSGLNPGVVYHLKASTSRSTRWASPWTLIWAWNFRRASSRSIPEKSISSRTQLKMTDHQIERVKTALTWAFPDEIMWQWPSTYSRTSLLNCCRLPRNSPIICRLSPFLSRINLAMPTGVSDTKPLSIRYWIPFSGFLQENKNQMFVWSWSGGQLQRGGQRSGGWWRHSRSKWLPVFLKSGW